MSYDPIKEAQSIALQEEMEQATKPRVLINTRFMEVWNVVGFKELINVNSISEAFPFTRTVSGKTQAVTKLVFMNGEDITVKHSYTDVKNALKQYFK